MYSPSHKEVKVPVVEWAQVIHSTRTRTQRSAGAYNSTMHYTVHYHAPLQQNTARRTRESTEESLPVNILDQVTKQWVGTTINSPNTFMEDRNTEDKTLYYHKRPPPSLLYCLRYIKVNVKGGGACRMSVTRCYYLRLIIPEKESYSNQNLNE